MLNHPFKAPHRASLVATLWMSLCLPQGIAHAQAPALEDPDEEDATEDAADAADESEDEDEAEAIEDGGTVSTTARPRRLPDPGQASSTVTREELDVRQPRSAPDALRYEPGVFVQQTAHSQGSAFIRGRTGQQTVLLFDDVRLNNSLFRQGPNQYFFTIDSRTIDHIDVVRGSASTRYGTDAIAGAVNAVPIEPRFMPGVTGLSVRPGVIYRHATADDESAGRLQLDAQLGPDLGLFAGFGLRRVGLLESGGPIYNPSDGELPEVPRFAEDGRTQLGTGFDEVTGDARLVWRIDDDKRMTLAYYDYRQYDAPRTDQCAPPYAPWSECLYYDEQFRSLYYGALEGRWGWWADRSKLVFSLQRQHERRIYDRPQSEVVNRGEDDVDTWGALWRAQTRAAKLSDHARLLARYGGEYYRDRVTSWAETELLALERVFPRSRGQYMDGSRYAWGGLWSELELQLYHQLVLRAGGRLSHISAYAPRDEESGTLGIDRTWTPLVGNLGLEWWANEWLTLLANADQGFRAPNLDDLTSRQRTGPGFQIENADLEPEHGVTLEVGARVATPRVEIDAWAYRATLEDAIMRTTRDVEACPPNTPECRTTWSRLQLVNLPGTAVIWGSEGSLKLNLPQNVSLQSTLSWAWGEGPRPLYQADDANRMDEERVPISRIPPLNGTVEALWRNTRGLYVGASLRWARTQDRLALSDISDARIPFGGTPGFAVLDARAGWRFAPRGAIHAVFENLTDEAYRYHGSSVNGPGRGLMINMELGL